MPLPTVKPSPAAIPNNPSIRPTPTRFSSTPRNRSSPRRSSTIFPPAKLFLLPKRSSATLLARPAFFPTPKMSTSTCACSRKPRPRVKVFSIGTTEEGREMIAVAVSSEANLKNLEQNHQRLAKLADPRTIHLNDDEADKLVADAVPVYYITGTIHSPETGAPTALMELAYRLAVDESPYIREIRDDVITLITPVVEVDGRDRMVDLYNWHLAHPKDFYPLPHLLGKIRRPRQQSRRHGRHAQAHGKRSEHLCRLGRAGASRPPRIRPLSLRQHRRRRPLQRLGRSHPRRRMANDRLRATSPT